MKYCPECAAPLVRANVAGRERDACPEAACSFVHWNNPLPVVAGIVQYEDQVVLVRNVGWPVHWYGLVTGFLESNEMPEQAVLREVREEIGLDGYLEGFVGMYEFYRMNQLIIAYHVRVDSREIELDTTEIAACKFVPIDRVRPWTAGTGRALSDWLARRGVVRELVDIDEAGN